MENGRPIRVAAAGDVHASPEERDRVVEAFASLEPGTDLFLLAGDLTTCGAPAEAAVLADACRQFEAPVCAVLGNHDWHLNRTQEVAAVLGRAGSVLERSSSGSSCTASTSAWSALKGFVGGFRTTCSRLRRAAATRGVRGDDEGRDRARPGAGGGRGRDVRIVLLHYAPTTTTLEGEPRGIWPFLGRDRLAAPIADALARPRPPWPRPRGHVRGLHRPRPGLQRRDPGHAEGLLVLRARAARARARGGV